jgi:hypothetical protein
VDGELSIGAGRLRRRPHHASGVAVGRGRVPGPTWRPCSSALGGIEYVGNSGEKDPAEFPDAALLIVEPA